MDESAPIISKIVVLLFSNKKDDIFEWRISVLRQQINFALKWRKPVLFRFLA
jgi:hypothetical protein